MWDVSNADDWRETMDRLLAERTGKPVDVAIELRREAMARTATPADPAAWRDLAATRYPGWSTLVGALILPEYRTDDTDAVAQATAVRRLLTEPASPLRIPLSPVARG
jgi:hypothetical protein